MSPAGVAIKERPVVIRASILLFGLIIATTTIQRWRGIPVDIEPAPDLVALVLLPMMLALSMVVQFFAIRRNSPLMLVSLLLALASLVLIVLRLKQ